MPEVTEAKQSFRRPSTATPDGSSLLDDLRTSPVTIYPLVAVLVLVAWLPASAAFSPAIYCAAALAILLLLAVTVAQGTSAPLGGSRARAIAIAAAVTFAGWNYASIGWADDRGAAFDGANRTALYAALFALFALTSWTPRLVYLAVGLYAVGAISISVGEFVRTVGSTNPQKDFISGRLTLPAGYENASAALLLIAVLAVVVVASRPELPTLVRVLSFAVATAGVDLVILAQSRGSLLGTSLAVFVLLLLVPNRHRVLGVILAIGGCALVAAPALAHVYGASDGGFKAFDAALHHSLRMMEVSVLAAGLAALLWSLATRLLPAAPRLRTVADRVVLAFIAAALAVPLAAALVRPHTARHDIASAWHSFAHAGSPSGAGSRFSSLGSDRYDLYRVALREISNHPAAGVGSDNFAIDYLRERRTDEEPLYPHSDILRIPAQTGIIGTLLALAFAGALLAGAFRSWRSAPTATIAVLVPIVYWFAHGAFDWLWEVPGVTAPVAAWAGIAVSLRSVASAPRSLPMPVKLVAFGLALAIAVPVGADWLSTRDAERALGHWRTNPAAAVGQLDAAARLNPFSDHPDLFAATIAGRVGDRRTMKIELDRAGSRNPANWYTHLLLAVLASDRKAWSTAAAEASRAALLNPREPTIAEVSHAIRLQRPSHLEAVENVFLARAAKRVRSGVTR